MMSRTPRRRIGRAALLASMAAAGVAAIPGSANAAEIAIDNGALSYRAEPGERNTAKISFEPGVIVVQESTATIDAAGVCSFSEQRRAFVCPRNGVVRLDATLGDRNDRLEVDPVSLFSNVSSRVEAGAGDDTVEIGEGRLQQSPDLASRRVRPGIRQPGFQTIADRISGIVLRAPGSTLIGGDGDDTLTGGPGADLIQGGNGADVLKGRQGADDIVGGTGGDTVDAGVGDDVVHGGPGNDSLRGDGDDDLIQADDGRDTVRGGAGSDALGGGAGNDTLSGQEDRDLLHGAAGDDLLLGGDGNDTLRGQGDDDRMRGGDGDDTLRGGAGNDTLGRLPAEDRGVDTYAGDAGDDVLRARDPDSVEQPACGAGRDEVTVESTDRPADDCEIQRLFS